MIRFCSIGVFEDEANKELKENISKEYVILDETIWERGRKYFARHKLSDDRMTLLPVLNRDQELICFAWQDEEANRELRMLRELDECDDALTFHDWNSDYYGVTIHGCNELAYYFAIYLRKRGIAVNVDGEFWQELCLWEPHTIPDCQNYEIWAEGVHHRNKDLYVERLRSVSAEFECIDEIYEANLKTGKIKNADGDVNELLKKLKNEKEIVIRGVGTKAHEAYDWLLANGIDICAFQSDKERSAGRTGLFTKPILRKMEVQERFPKAVFIECSEKYSAWGFGAVDLNDYEGYERNRRYFLLRDYIEVPENNLIHIFQVLQGKNIVLIGDVRLCCRFNKWWKKRGIKMGGAVYWDILEENTAEIEKMQLQKADSSKLAKKDIYMLIVPEYDSEYHITEETANRHKAYAEKLHEYGIYDYTDYYSDMFQCIHLEIEDLKYMRKQLRPAKILLGAIPPHSGNTLLRHSLAGHPQILMIQEVGYFNNNLYSICIRLAEENSADILSGFWHLYKQEAGEEAIMAYFPDRGEFERKTKELLSLNDYFTSQELFVIFHLAYEAMHGREISDLENAIIYWEPHQWDRELVREWSYWLGCKEVKGFLVSMVRNTWMRIGSGIRTDFYAGKRWSGLWGSMGIWDWRRKNRKIYGNWVEKMIRFEDLKSSPKEEYMKLCEWLGISFDDVLLETTCHGKTAYYRNIVGDTTGFDLEPIHKLYEEYFNSFDRMRLCLIDGPFQRKYGYPYISCLDFSRRELQEMFLKEFRWEKLPEMEKGEDRRGIWQMNKHFVLLLWQVRFMEVMDFWFDEED